MLAHFSRTFRSLAGHFCPEKGLRCHLDKYWTLPEPLRLVEPLTHDLKRLRRGRGVYASDLPRRLSPALRALCDIQDSDGQAESRRKLITALHMLADELPTDLKMAFLAALAIHENARHRLLEERLRWLAGQLDRDIRTARRRVDNAFQVIAAHAAESAPSKTKDGSAYAPAGWHLASLESLVRLDGSAPTVMEVREVVAEVDGLEQVLISTSVPRHPDADPEKHDLAVEVLYGAVLASRERLTATYFRFLVTLPRVLLRGERHRIGVVLRLPDGQPMYPRYTYQPMRRCERFELRLRFDASSKPDRVWRVAGLPRGMFEDFVDPDALTPLDPFGEVQLSFQQLRPGLAYGARWE
jgi:hypothetical protein